MSTEKDLQALISRRDRQIVELTLAGTRYVRDQTILAEAAGKVLAKHFTLEDDGKMVVVKAVDKDGVPIWSSQRPGEQADLEEAAQLLIESRYAEYLLPDDLRQNQNGIPSQESTRAAHTLVTQYREAKERRDVQAMTALKNRMSEVGLKAPL